MFNKQSRHKTRAVKTWIRVGGKGVPPLARGGHPRVPKSAAAVARGDGTSPAQVIAYGMCGAESESGSLQGGARARAVKTWIRAGGKGVPH